ncbi:unnamed protein product [Paramecium octaurelia]|uniref:Tetratricopeptide repeat protein n=1 Tax=Paramecium octaurelia TaxID=43137 RepID=A0A8S1RWY0_PAROT|nr:unnamed protein product [Paramecium octaurelia]
MSEIVQADTNIEQEIFKKLARLHIGFLLLVKKSGKLKKIDEASERLFQQMINHFILGEFTLAIEIAEKLKLKHQLKFIYRFQAQCYIHLNQFENAETCLEQALQIKPQSCGILHNLYNINMQKGDYQRAKDYINELKKLDNNPIYEYLLGITYQKINEHEKAIQCFEIAHQCLQKKRYFMAKSESYLALERYDEALECCMIAFCYEPCDKNVKIVLLTLIVLLKISEEELERMQLKIDEQHNYTIETYKKKRELEAQQTQLIKRQSKIRINSSQIQPTQSQIKINKQNQFIKYYLDAIYYTFTYFFALYANADQNCTAKIANYLSTKQNIEMFDFTDRIRETIQKCYPDLQNLSTHEISRLLNLWYDKKIKDKDNKNDIYQHLYIIFRNLTESNLKQQLFDRFNEGFTQSQERQNKNKEFHSYLQLICTDVLKKGFRIYNEFSGVIGLEHAIMILGFLIKFPELADDKDSFEDLVFRGLTKEDFYQLLKSQSRLSVSLNQPSKQLEKLEQSVFSDTNFLSKFQ